MEAVRKNLDRRTIGWTILTMLETSFIDYLAARLSQGHSQILNTGKVSIKASIRIILSAAIGVGRYREDTLNILTH